MKPVSWIVALGAVGTAYYLIEPSSGLMPPCPFYMLTELYCPGCGSQRGVHALVHGDIGAALRLNPLLPVALTFAALESCLFFLQKRGYAVRMISSKKYTPVIVLAIILFFWILRNIPVQPFTYLAPHS